METLGAVVVIVALALVIVWNVFHSRRIDALGQRVDALEKK